MCRYLKKYFYPPTKKILSRKSCGSCAYSCLIWTTVLYTQLYGNYCKSKFNVKLFLKFKGTFLWTIWEWNFISFDFVLSVSRPMNGLLNVVAKCVVRLGIERVLNAVNSTNMITHIFWNIQLLQLLYCVSFSTSKTGLVLIFPANRVKTPLL